MALLFESLTMDILTLSVAMFGFLYWYFTSTYNYWKKRGVFYLEPTPFFGNMKDNILMRTSSAEIFQQLYQQLGDHKYGGVWQFQKPTLILKDPDMIKLFLIKDFPHFHDRGFPVDEKRNPLSEHLFSLGGTKWRKLRIKLTPTFTSGKMKMMFHAMNECALELKEYLAESAQNGENLELKDLLGKFTTDIIGTCAFGMQFNAMKDPNSEFREMGKRIFTPTTIATLRGLFSRVFPTIAKYLNVRFLSKDITEFFLSTVKDTVEYREKNNVVRNDFLQLLIQIKNKGKVDDDHETESMKNEKVAQNGSAIQNGKAIKNGDYKKEKEEDDNIELYDSLLAAQVFVFFLAGFETSSSTMSFCLHELALNSDIQDRVREEVDSVLAEYDGKITYEAIQKMEYLDRVVAETLRKYPPASNLLREVTKPYTIPDSDIHLEKGLQVIIPTYALHRDPKYFPDPERFDPERFTEENKAKRHNFSYLPFGEGPRICIGMRFGLMQTKIGLAILLHNYQFNVCKRTAIPLRLDPKSFVLSSMDGVWLQITNRA